ncbi:hypothetical protein ONE63_003378 [Megalurothrips usitatus]|uniref:Uncharacterized protein n=1 Tax=Megalurothrips usitatus TaxID=439358 RepID=A0AAV7XB51_9NEOP|nr:hypothetical protein ONE63_003378 [Megalurothrips usitatus]
MLVDDDAVGEIKYMEQMEDGSVQLKRNSHHHFQIQANIHITGQTTGYFVVYMNSVEKNWMYVETMARDDDHRAKTAPKLSSKICFSFRFHTDIYAQWKEFRGVPKEAWQDDYEKLPAYLARMGSSFGGGAGPGLEANIRLGLRAGKTPEEIVEGLSPKLRERWAARQEAVQQPTAGDGPTPPKQRRAYQRRGELSPPAARALNTARDENQDPEGHWGLAAGGRAPSPLAAQLAHPAPLRLHLGPQLPASVLPPTVRPAPNPERRERYRKRKLELDTEKKEAGGGKRRRRGQGGSELRAGRSADSAGASGEIS